MVLGTQSDCQRPRMHKRHLNRDFFDAYDDAAGHYGAPETQSHAAPQALDCHRSTGGWLSHITRRSTTFVCHLMCDTWCLTPRVWVFLRFAWGLLGGRGPNEGWQSSAVNLINTLGTSGSR